MENNKKTGKLSNEKQLTENENFQLLCCGVIRQGGGGMSSVRNLEKDWLTAAELINLLTKETGTVIDENIIFKLDDGKKIEISLLGGHYSIYDKDSKAINSGRKAFELLMHIENLSFEASIKWLAEQYSVNLADKLATDYLKMKIDSLQK